MKIEQLVLSLLTYMKVCRDMILCLRCVCVCVQSINLCAYTQVHAGFYFFFFFRVAVTALALKLTCKRAEMKAWIVSHIQISSSV